MKRRLLTLCILTLSVTFFGQACATKKYVRKTIDERVAPLEGRTAELEQSVARNTSAIKEVDARLSSRIDTVSAKAEEATLKAQEADRKALEAQAGVERTNTRLTNTERSIDDFAEVKVVSVYFKTNSFELSPESKAELDALAEAAKGRKGVRIEISGFADRRGTVRKNEVLTENRAEAVRRYLFNVHRIENWRMQFIGAGKIEDDAQTPEELQKNRRVDIRLLENKVVSGANATRDGE